MFRYNPDDVNHRRLLAKKVIAKLEACGFTEDENASGERIFFRAVPDSPNRVVVYTTVVRGFVRANGKDAIRISGVTTNSQGKSLGLVKNTRVNRIGDIDSIVERMYQRMRETYRKVMNPERCRFCNSPKFISSKGNLVCSEFCWTR